MAADAPKRILEPDASAEDYRAFYGLVGRAQLEEAYYVRQAYALARHHLLSDLLAPYAVTGRQLLDAGCASGYYAVRYALMGGSVSGIDIADGSVDLARDRARRAGVDDRCTFATGDVRALPLDDGTFDLVLATEVLEHVREQRRALGELARVLRPGGTLVVSSPGALDGLPFRRRLRLRGARSAESAGVEVERVGHSRAIEEAGIQHAPYFHDAFTLEGLRELLPAELEVRALRSLWFVPPLTLTYGFLAVDAIRRRLPGVRGPRPSTSEPDSGPIAIPGPSAEARAIMAWTRALWRLPVMRRTGVGVLLVARRRESMGDAGRARGLPTPAAGSAAWWGARSELDPLAAVLDPSEGAERKNRHIDRIHRLALRRLTTSARLGEALDFGCGAGRMTTELAPFASRVTGVDISAEMIARAERSHAEPNVRFCVYDGERLPFDDATFDSVLSVLVLQMYVDEPVRFRAIARELARVLRPGGRLWLIERAGPDPAGPAWTGERWRDELRDAGLALGTLRAVRHADPSPIFRAVLRGWVPQQRLEAAAGLDLALAARRGIRAPYTECLMRVHRA